MKPLCKNIIIYNMHLFMLYSMLDKTLYYNSNVQSPMMCDNNSMCKIAFILFLTILIWKLNIYIYIYKTLVNTESIKHSIFQFEQIDQNEILIITIIIIYLPSDKKTIKQEIMSQRTPVDYVSQDK